MKLDGDGKRAWPPKWPVKLSAALVFGGIAVAFSIGYFSGPIVIAQAAFIGALVGLLVFVAWFIVDFLAELHISIFHEPPKSKQQIEFESELDQDFARQRSRLRQMLDAARRKNRREKER